MNGNAMELQWNCNKKEKFRVNNMPKIRKRKREKNDCANMQKNINEKYCDDSTTHKYNARQ